MLLAFPQLLCSHHGEWKHPLDQFWEPSFIFGGKKLLMAMTFLVYYDRRYFHFTWGSVYSTKDKLNHIHIILKRVHKMQYYYWNAWPFPYITLHSDRSFTGGSGVNNPPVMQKMPRVRSLGLKDPVEEGMVTHSSIFGLENLMDRGVWEATVHRVAWSWTWLKQPSMHTY